MPSQTTLTIEADTRTGFVNPSPITSSPGIDSLMSLSRLVYPNPYALNPTPSTLHPQPFTSNKEPKTLKPGP